MPFDGLGMWAGYRAAQDAMRTDAERQEWYDAKGLRDMQRDKQMKDLEFEMSPDALEKKRLKLAEERKQVEDLAVLAQYRDSLATTPQGLADFMTAKTGVDKQGLRWVVDGENKYGNTKEGTAIKLIDAEGKTIQTQVVPAKSGSEAFESVLNYVATPAEAVKHGAEVGKERRTSELKMWEKIFDAGEKALDRIKDIQVAGLGYAGNVARANAERYSADAYSNSAVNREYLQQMKNLFEMAGGQAAAIATEELGAPIVFQNGNWYQHAKDENGMPATGTDGKSPLLVPIADKNIMSVLNSAFHNIVNAQQDATARKTAPYVGGAWSYNSRGFMPSQAMDLRSAIATTLYGNEVPQIDYSQGLLPSYNIDQIGTDMYPSTGLPLIQAPGTGSVPVGLRVVPVSGGTGGFVNTPTGAPQTPFSFGVNPGAGLVKRPVQ